MEPKLETLHKIYSGNEISISDGEPSPRPPSPEENDRSQNVPSRDSGDKRMRKLGVRRICSQAPKRSNKRGRPISKKDVMTPSVIVGLLASDRMGAGSPSMEDSSGDDDGSSQRPSHRVRKIKWTEHLIRVFLELFDRELAALNYMQNVPHADGKMRIVRDFNERCGIKLPWESFKHKYDNLRRLYIAWEKLTGYTNVSIDSITGQITMDDQWWKDRELEIPLSKTLHRHPILHMELMHRVFKNHSVRRSNAPSPNTPALHTVVVTGIDLCKTVPETWEDHTRDPSLHIASPVPTCDDPTSTESPITPSSSIAPSPIRSYKEQTYLTTNPKGTSRDRIPPSRKCISRRKTVSKSRIRRRPHQQWMLVSFKEAFCALNKLDIVKFTDFWWASARILKEDVEWRESFVEFNSDREKIEFLEGLTGYDRNNNYIGLKGLQAFEGNINGNIN